MLENDRLIRFLLLQIKSDHLLAFGSVNLVHLSDYFPCRFFVYIDFSGIDVLGQNRIRSRKKLLRIKTALSSVAVVVVIDFFRHEFTPLD